MNKAIVVLLTLLFVGSVFASPLLSNANPLGTGDKPLQTTESVTGVKVPEKMVCKGDFNRNGIIEAWEAKILGRYLYGMPYNQSILFWMADFNDDHQVDQQDLGSILSLVGQKATQCR